MAKAGSRRARIQIKKTETGCWYPVVVDRAGRELERGPVETEEGKAADAANNMRRFGAWRVS